MTTNVGPTLNSLVNEFGPVAGSTLYEFIAGAERVHMMEGNAGLWAKSNGLDDGVGQMLERVAKEIGPDHLAEAQDFVHNNPIPA